MSGDARAGGDVRAIEERLLAFVRRELVADDVAVDRETDLLTGEVLDSMSVLRLAAYIGEAFEIDVGAADLVVDHFRSIGAIAAYVRRRLDARPRT